MESKIVDFSYTNTVSAIFIEQPAMEDRSAPEGSIEIDDYLLELESTSEGASGLKAGSLELSEILKEIEGTTVRTLRLAAGLSQVEVAARAKMSQPQVARIEQGAGDPQLSTLERLAEALGVEPVEMFLAWRETTASTGR